MTFEQLQQANAQIKTTNISGKQYATVAERITAFRRLYPEGFIETSVELIDENTCMARASIGYYEDGQKRILGTGTAFEDKGASRINALSFIENAETSATGRAIGMLGLLGATKGQASVASAEEMNKIARITERQVGAILKIYQGNDAGLMDLMDAVKVSEIGNMTIEEANEILTAARSHNWTALTHEELEKIRRRKK